LQQKTSTPMTVGGCPEPSIRLIRWVDVAYSAAPSQLAERTTNAD
jgi:hypothetical protein